MPVVQQADFEKIKSEYNATILIIAGKCIGYCHYPHDFISCILALHGFASKMITIYFNSESVTASKYKFAKCLLLSRGTTEQVLPCQVSKADDRHYYSYDSDPSILLHLHDIPPRYQYPDEF